MATTKQKIKNTIHKRRKKSVPQVKKTLKGRINIDAAVRSYNEFVHGTPYPVHTHAHGYLDPGNRRHRMLLD